MSFQEAIAYVKALPPTGEVQLSNEEKLVFYGLYKQATEGENTTAQPWAVQMEARAKHDAWSSRKGMSKADAEAEYVKQLTDIVKSKSGKDWK